MGVRFTILLAVLFLLALATVSAESCAQMTGYNSLVCGGSPDSSLGVGAVDICNVCYPCGAADGVCPEDFYTDASGRGSCRFCPDPDCMVLIDGTVEDTTNSGVEGANIIALYEPDIKETVGITNINGYYTATVRTGYIKLYVSYQDFDSRILNVDIIREHNSGVVKTVDFTGVAAIEPGSCSATCTDNFGTRCKASCDGINGCQFNNHTVSTLCDDKIAGSRVFLTEDSYITCCQGSEVEYTDDNRIDSFSPFAGQLKNGADDLVTFTQRARSFGERVNLQVVVWGSNE